MFKLHISLTFCNKHMALQKSPQQVFDITMSSSCVKDLLQHATFNLLTAFTNDLGFPFSRSTLHLSPLLHINVVFWRGNKNCLGYESLHENVTCCQDCWHSKPNQNTLKVFIHWFIHRNWLLIPHLCKHRFRLKFDLTAKPVSIVIESLKSLFWVNN